MAINRFTTNPDPVRPPINSGPYAYREVNVAAQRTDRASLLNWTERSIRLRKELPELGRGSWTILDTPSHILALRYDWEGEMSLIVHNLIDEATEVPLDSPNGRGDQGDLVCLQTDERIAAGAAGCHRVILQPFGYRWFRMGGLDELVQQPGARH